MTTNLERVSKRIAFSLVEILVATTIVAILVAIITIVAKGAILRSKSAQSAENLRQIGIASALYAGAHDDYLPPYLTHSAESGPLNPDGTQGHPALAWKESLLDYGLVDEQFYAPLDPHAKKLGPRINLDDHLHSSYRHNGTLSFLKAGKVLYLSLTGIPDSTGTIHIYENGKEQVRVGGQLFEVPYDNVAFEVLYFDGHVKRVPKQF